MEQPIQDKAPKPPGLLPKNLQAFVLVGLALLMVVIMAITGHKRPAAITNPASPAIADPLPVNADRVMDFQKGIEQSQRASAPLAEASLLQQQRLLASQGQVPGHVVAQPTNQDNPSAAYPPGSYAGVPSAEGQAPADPIVDEQKKRHYLSLFADNVALSYRKDAGSSQNRTPTNAPSAHSIPTEDASLVPSQEEIEREQRMLQQLQQSGTLVPNPSAQATQKNDPAPQRAEVKPQQDPKEGRDLDGPKFVLFEGTILETLLMNRLDGSFSGPVSCLLSNNIYSHDRQHLLIPAGSKILGEAAKVDASGQARLAVVFHRLLMPDGFSVSLDPFKGLDQEGSVTLHDRVNNHYARVFGASLAIGLLGSAAQIGTGSTLNASGSDRLQQGFGASMAASSDHVLDHFLNVLPTVTIREGTRVKVYLSNDLLLPEYNAHSATPTF